MGGKHKVLIPGKSEALAKWNQTVSKLFSVKNNRLNQKVGWPQLFIKVTAKCKVWPLCLSFRSFLSLAEKIKQKRVDMLSPSHVSPNTEYNPCVHSMFIYRIFFVDLVKLSLLSKTGVKSTSESDIWGHKKIRNILRPKWRFKRSCRSVFLCVYVCVRVYLQMWQWAKNRKWGKWTNVLHVYLFCT